MAIFESYSKRKKGISDVYTYDTIPEKLKNQVYHIWNDYFKQRFPDELIIHVRKGIYDTICREEGKKKLYLSRDFFHDSPTNQVEKYFNQLEDTDKILDVIELTFKFIIQLEKWAENSPSIIRIEYFAIDAINDLNQRFRENSLGYEFIDGQIIRIDNQLLHTETIQTTINLLHEPDFNNANEEFLKAHEHFRFKRNQECLNECLKAFESIIKIACHKNNWEYKETDTAKPLINILISNKFFPIYHENYLSAIRQLLESSIPTIRNKNSGHGQGTRKIIVPDNLASYMLYITGATIRLLVETQLGIDNTNQ